LILGEVNRLLAGYAAKNKLPIQYKMGPDPSSIDSCMVGGVVSNNSSGMCCGVSQNTYHTLKVRPAAGCFDNDYVCVWRGRLGVLAVLAAWAS
jgi:hypothetical protein